MTEEVATADLEAANASLQKALQEEKDRRAREQEILKERTRATFAKIKEEYDIKAQTLTHEADEARKSCSVAEQRAAKAEASHAIVLEGFWVRGRVCGDHSVFVTSHRPAHLLRAHASSLIKLCISHLKCFLFAHFPPRAPPCLWIWSLQKFWTNSLFLKLSGQSSWTRHA